MVGFPLLLIPLAVYNIIAFLMPGVSFTDPLIKLTPARKRVLEHFTWRRAAERTLVYMDHAASTHPPETVLGAGSLGAELQRQAPAVPAVLASWDQALRETRATASRAAQVLRVGFMSSAAGKPRK